MRAPASQESDVERIFDIYVTKPAGESQGVGLGLPLSRRLAQAARWGASRRCSPGPGRLLYSGAPRGVSSMKKVS